MSNKQSLSLNANLQYRGSIYFEVIGLCTCQIVKLNEGLQFVCDSYPKNIYPQPRVQPEQYYIVDVYYLICA